MTTTIQVSDETVVILKKLRHQLHLSSYDAVIHQTLCTKHRSRYGALGRIDKKLLLKDIRDKHDRF